MGKVIKFIVGVIMIILIIVCIKSCRENNEKKDKLEDKNTQIELIVQGPTCNNDWGDNKVINYVSVGFKNVGSEDVIKVTCKIYLYDAENNEIGVIDYSYNIYDGIGEGEIVKQYEATPLYVMLHENNEGKIAVDYDVKDLKVNDRKKSYNKN